MANMANAPSIVRSGARRQLPAAIAAIVLCALVPPGAVTGHDYSSDFSFPTDSNARYENDPCSLTGAMPRTGICRKAADCPIGIRSKGERCEFSGNDAVVCCPTSETSINRYGARIAKQECENFDRHGHSNLTDHLTGRRFLVELGEFPFMALISFGGEDNEELKCGATLISNRFLLTAAHCTRQNISFVRLGMVDTNDKDASVYRVRQVLVHEEYKGRRNDIALIEVTEDITTSRFVRPICLNTELVDIGPSVNLTIMGWGIDNDNNQTNVLYKGTVNEIPLNVCRKRFRDLFFSNTISETQICALGEKYMNGTTDTCPGDSGGPLVVTINEKPYLAGVVSYGITCGQDIPGIYTRITHYLDWIEQHVWPNRF
uniref:Peptidase S1 domain-containing protein n=1 Tax=Anopheles farauti TaxID=69004 RepID=A0A182QR23_9DIPT